MFELGYYFFLFLTCYVALLLPKTFVPSSFVPLSLLLGLSAISRLSDLDTDMRVFADTAKYFNQTFYMMREVSFWWTQHQFYLLFGTPVVFYILADLVTGYLLWQVVRTEKHSLSVFINFYLFFPSIAGFQNTYRQFLASMIFLYIYHSRNSQYIWGALAVTIHNVSVIFAPYMMFKRKGVVSFMLACLITLSIVALLPLAGQFKSSAATGRDLEVLLAILCVSFTVMLFLIKPTKMGAPSRLMLICIIILASTVFLASAASERIAFFYLIVMYPSLISSINKFQQRRTLLVAFLSVNAVVVFFSPYKNFISPF